MEDSWSWLGQWGYVDATERPRRFLDYLEGFHTSDSVAMAGEVLTRALELKAGDRCLEVGCGAGHITARLARLVRAVGIDKSRYLIGAARPQANAEYQVADLYALPFSPQSFDGCFAYRVFQHLERPQAALAEMARVVRPGGKLAVWEPVWRAWVIDSSFPEISRILIDGLCASVANSDVTQKLPALFLDAGLQVQAVPLPAVEQGQASPASWQTLKMACDRARDTGALTAGQTEEWLLEQEIRSREGRFFALHVNLLVIGMVAQTV